MCSKRIEYLANYCKISYYKIKYCAKYFMEVSYMQRILVVGATKLAYEYINLISSFHDMKIVAVIGGNSSSQIVKLVQALDIPFGDSLKKWLDEDIDFILETTGDQQSINYIQNHKGNSTLLIWRSVLEKLLPYVNELYTRINNQELILNNIEDGLIVINNSEHVQLINEAASNIVGVNKEEATGQLIKEIIANSKLPDVLQNQLKEVNKKMTLANGKQIISTRIPLINDKKRLVGAFAIFKDSNEVIRLAEENTDLKEIKTMLEAIIQSSDEAISVVDEKGLGLMINPAYTRITGLNEDDVIGKPATTDITEGARMHMKVLQSRRTIRGAKLKVGPNKKEVLVNVAPVIVAGKLKGSVGVLTDISEIQQLTLELKR